MNKMSGAARERGTDKVSTNREMKTGKNKSTFDLISIRRRLSLNTLVRHFHDNLLLHVQRHVKLDILIPFSN